MKKSLKGKKKVNSKPLCVLGTFDVGGAEMFVLNLLRAGEKLDAACVIPDRGAFEDEMNGLGCMTYHMTRRSVSLIRHHLDLWHIIHDNRYKTVYFHTQNAFFTSLHIITARLAGADKIIVHSHNTKDWRKGKAAILHDHFRKWLYRHSDIRIACGKDAAGWLFGTDKDVYILPLPVDCDAFHYSDIRRASVRKEMGIPMGTEVYLHVGRFDIVKNHNGLLEIFQKICEMNSETGRRSLLILAGGGVLFNEMKKKAAKLGINDNVLFLGITDRVSDLAVAADKFILPSFYEGFPTVLLEAQAAGLPCFVSDTIDRDIDVTGGNVHFISLDKAPGEWAEEILSVPSNTNLQKSKISGEIREKYDIFAVKEMLHEILS